MFGLWKRRAATEDTRLALGQLQHGQLEAAQNTCLDALRKAWQPGSAFPRLFHIGLACLSCGLYAMCDMCCQMTS